MQMLAYLFLPHPSNNFKAKILQSQGILFLILLLFITYLLRVPHKVADILGYTASSLPVEQIINETNKKRVEAGLSLLSVDENLARAARAKGLHMLEKDYWSHIAPDGTTPWDFFNQVGYRYQYAGENLARDFDSPNSVVNAWMASPTHKENLLSAKYKDIGIAVVEGELNGRPTTLVVQLFGSKPQGIGLVQASGETYTEQEPAVTQQPSASNIQTKTLFSSVGLASPFTVQRTLILGLVGLLIIILVVDGFVILHLGIIRISGRNLAHLGFLVSIGVLVLVIEGGKIL